VPTIFISHSAKSADDQTYLAAIAAGLEQAGFTVWLDRQNLGAGDDWNLKISNNLVYCQGAVVLVSTQSLGSFYVQHEISNLLLRWRRERDPQTRESAFPLCPVLLSDDVKPELEKGFSKAIRFTDVNYIAACAATDALTALVAAFKGVKDFDSDNSPLAAVEDQIMSILAVPTMRRVLLRAAQQAKFPAPAGATVEAIALELARCLLTRPLEAVYQFLLGLGATITQEQRRNLFHLAAPAWVSPEAARTLIEVMAETPPRACIVNAEQVDFTPGMYLRRARLELPELAGQVVGVRAPTAGQALQQLRRQVLVAVAARLSVDGEPTDAAFESNVRTEIARRLAATQRPILLAVPVAETDLDLIGQLREDPVFYGVTFMALCKDATPADDVKGLTWLDPELRPNQEQSAFEIHNQLIQTFR
jgi:hypothetical protein